MLRSLALVLPLAAPLLAQQEAAKAGPAFSLENIFPEKKKCISCNVCTSVCHQGIDVMSFANRGLPMEDPQCVRCSACVQGCPTGVLTFGHLGRNGQQIHDRISASLVQIEEPSRSPERHQ